MIGHQRPGVTRGKRFLQQTGKPFKKIPTVLIILENRLFFDPSNNDVVHGTWGIYAGLARHMSQIQNQLTFVNKETTSL